MFNKILIANRGEIACRVARTARRLGMGVVAVYSDADAGAPHVRMADEAWRLGPAPSAESYLRGDAIIAAALESGAQAIHPGYGFLAENADFAEACAAAGLVFIGPPPDAIRAMGLKHAAKDLMRKAGVPVVPGHEGDAQDAETLLAAAQAIGWPVLIKPVAGGGGKGMRRVDVAGDFAAALEGARREAANSFGDDRVLLEKYIARPRHIEIQVFCDAHGGGVHLFERDCSCQRRHQKVIEEAPAPGMPDDLRAAMGDAAIRAAKAVGYVGAGTVEFIAPGEGALDGDSFWFLEMNTRLQVEHPVTEMITGLDLVEWQLMVAAGQTLPMGQDDLAITGHAIEARLYAEDPARDFLPATGRLDHLHLPEMPGGRVDTGVRQGDTITPFYDPMIAKLIAHGPTRDAARRRLIALLAASRVEGCVTNRDFLVALLDQPDFAAGRVDTGLIERHLDDLVHGEETPPDAALATAALFAMGALNPPAGNDPWDRLTGFRLWEGARQVVHLGWAGQVSDVVMRHHGTRWHLEHGERVIADFGVADLDSDRVLLDLGDRRLTVSWTARAGGLAVHAAGRTWRFDLPDRILDDDDGVLGGGVLKADLPGRVIAVHVVAGDTVARGQVLLAVEAMKMEHGITAPFDGVVAELRVVLGDQVVEGDTLAILEEGSDD